MLSERRQIFVGHHLDKPILTAEVTAALYIDHTRPYASLKKEPKGGEQTSPIRFRRHLVFLFLRQPCLALWNHVKLSSGTLTSTKS